MLPVEDRGPIIPHRQVCVNSLGKWPSQGRRELFRGGDSTARAGVLQHRTDSEPPELWPITSFVATSRSESLAKASLLIWRMQWVVSKLDHRYGFGGGPASSGIGSPSGKPSKYWHDTMRTSCQTCPSASNVSISRIHRFSSFSSL